MLVCDLWLCCIYSQVSTLGCNDTFYLCECQIFELNITKQLNILFWTWNIQPRSKPNLGSCNLTWRLCHSPWSDWVNLVYLVKQIAKTHNSVFLLTIHDGWTMNNPTVYYRLSQKHCSILNQLFPLLHCCFIMFYNTFTSGSICRDLYLKWMFNNSVSGSYITLTFLRPNYPCWYGNLGFVQHNMR